MNLLNQLLQATRNLAGLGQAKLMALIGVRLKIRSFVLALTFQIVGHNKISLRDLLATDWPTLTEL